MSETDTSSNGIQQTIDSLLQLAFKYQLAFDGNFIVSKKTSTTTIKNSSFEDVGFRFISCEKYDFDGGIQLHFVCTGELSEILERFTSSNLIHACIHNLWYENNDDFEYYSVSEGNDCDWIHVNVIECKSSSIEQKREFEKCLKIYWESNKIGKIRTACAVKL
jgi:hypothetical protein